MQLVSSIVSDFNGTILSITKNFKRIFSTTNTKVDIYSNDIWKTFSILVLYEIFKAY